MKRWEALLLAENGPSPELEAILADLTGLARNDGQRAVADDVETWIRAQFHVV
ncbi:hypothetical protein ACFVTE_14005 [Arthrobacter sp. NPDC058097]|uniref:hypothetical protein n=1 Tax=Arthrobacter sp. NPDC058097 TaxID=3346340 RepID=UPI0036D8E388